MNDLSYDSKEYMGFDFPELIFDFPELIKESNSYPSNVCVHGNGFIQIKIAEGLYEHETRLHIWHPILTKLTQQVNTQIHDHRFGFISTVLAGVQKNIEIEWYDCTIYDSDTHSRWWAKGDRLPTGNRPLVCDNKPYMLEVLTEYEITRNKAYYMPPKQFHQTEPVTDIVVTLMTKTEVLDNHDASVFCEHPLKPDQKFDRFQIPWNDLEKIIKDCLFFTPFNGVKLWQ